jgi:hypothetical protein
MTPPDDIGMTAPARPAFVRRMSQRGHQRVRSNGVDFFSDLAMRDAGPSSEWAGEGDGGL